MLLPRPPRLVVVAALAAVITAATTAGCGGTKYDSTKENWPFISATIMEPSCATVNCHSAITHQGGVDLSSSTIGYQALVGIEVQTTDAGTTGGMTYYVYPYYPQYSQLMTLLNTVGPLRMPPDNPLPQADVELISNWISGGAQPN